MLDKVRPMEYDTNEPHDLSLTVEESEQYQLFALNRVYQRVMESSLFYQRKFSGFIGRSIETLEDFQQLPFTTKEELREGYPLGLQAVPNRDIVRIHSSSGTTGKPVIIP